VVSSSWLKESFREGRFVGKNWNKLFCLCPIIIIIILIAYSLIFKIESSDELPHILNDPDYSLKYKCDLKSAVLRAKASSHTLFKGYNICIAAHVQTPAKILSAIVMSAGGNVSPIIF